MSLSVATLAFVAALGTELAFIEQRLSDLLCHRYEAVFHTDVVPR